MKPEATALKHFVKIYYEEDGLLSIRNIEVPRRKAGRINIIGNGDYFMFFDQYVFNITSGQEIIQKTSEPFNFSKSYFPEAKLVSADEYQKSVAADKTQEFKPCPGFSRYIHCRSGQFRPFREGQDVILRPR